MVPVPKADWFSTIKSTALELLKDDGLLFVLGKSSPMHSFLKDTKGFSTVEDKKYRGHRAVVLRKN